MNKDRRKRLNAVISQLQALPSVEEIKSELESIRDDEQEAYDNMPESLQSGDRGQASQEAISKMEEVIDALDGFNPDYLVTDLEAAAE